jgi:hypothetical protein
MGSSLSPPGPNAVHLCVDMQNLFTSRGPWPTPWMEKALPSAACRTFPRTNRVHPFHSAASASGVGGGANYKRWDNVTRDPLSPDVLELVPELREFVPPAGVIDRLGCGQQDSLPPSVRPSDGQRPFSRTLLALRSKCAAFLPQTLQPQSCAGRWQQLILGRGGRAKGIEEQ